ncbi:bifunctional 3-(3-hydroxy-phenyl)propionate/3-hydroxycinnamic acid hydroxylase [Gallaecimonas kandeliae]|nr:bifunctional 3-(3-hydroxy-phenyl)propionate/3-hydroxycinnamic acid hydroxylase [Gallaecimonas kandeliae]WKE67471.1 bifunctional 3-(3-hydroxy-phenyl)propionate/3-hydroxycinnamic acid hydroxylase [Gallaecimonas kandeliae]
MKTENASSLPEKVDVLVVGFGPVGAALASLLGRYGVKTLVVEKSPEILLMPRAIALDNEALRILQMAGLNETAFERIEIQEVKMHCPYLGQFARINTSGSIDGHPKLVTFYQPELERALRRQVKEYPCIAVSSGCELVGFEQSDEGVLASIKEDSGQVRQVAARYLVGADGASSKVRHLIGQGFQGQTFTEDWLIVDAKGREGKAIDHVEFLCNPARPVPHMPAPGGRERWEFMLQRGEKKEEMEHPDKIAELLAPWIPREGLTIERKAVYRFHARCCEAFQKGRVFLIGDAAHITPPFVGQGLVAGLRDAANLGWKLAWALSGKATPAILDSYDQERRPHAMKMINLARFMGRLVMPSSKVTAVLIHGLMRMTRLLPSLRRYFEELEMKPANRFDKGLFLQGNKSLPLHRGGQLAQGQVRQGDQVGLSDDFIGDHLALIGFGVDPQEYLDPELRRKWLLAGGRFLEIGRQGQNSETDTLLLEDLNGTFRQEIKKKLVAAVRPDRVVMHTGDGDNTSRVVTDCLTLLKTGNTVQLRKESDAQKTVSHAVPE